MKKIISLLLCLCLFTTITFAQAKPAAKTVKKETPKAATTAPTKKDGTPDKRFKENKKPAPAATGPVKKDGTPDKRYKANKKG